MFAGRGQQSLVLTLTADFRKVRHILFGSGYGAKVNIFKWINYPLLWVESRILILFWFFSFSITFTEYPSNFFPKSKSEVADYPPPKSKLPTFPLSPNPKLQITPPEIQTSNFFPKSKFEVAEYPPPKSKLPTFSLSPNPKLQITPPPKSKLPTFSLSPNPKLQITPPKKSKLPTFPLSLNPKLQIPLPPRNPNFQLFPKSKSEVADYPPEIQTSNFSPKSKSEVADYPPPPKSKLPTFSLSPNPKLQITPPRNRNFQLFP